MLATRGLRQCEQLLANRIPLRRITGKMNWRAIWLLIGLPAVLCASEGPAEPVAAYPLAPGHAVVKRATAWIPEEPPVPGLIREGQLSVTAGAREVSGEAWNDLPPVFQMGIDWTMGPPSWPLRPIICYRHASGSGQYEGAGRYLIDLAQLGTYVEPSDRGVISGEFQELGLGAVSSWSWWRLRADIAGGGCWVRADLEDTPSLTVLRQLTGVTTQPTSDADDGLGWWASAGLRIAVGDALLGVEGRYTDARLEVFGEDLQAGGWQLGGTVGWSW